MLVRRDAARLIDFAGLQIHDYTPGVGSSSSLATVTLPPGGRHTKAWSTRSDKYYYVLDGALRFVVDGEAHDLAVGDLCLVRQGQRFQYENRWSQPAMLLLVHTPGYDPAAEIFVDVTATE